MAQALTGTQLVFLGLRGGELRYVIVTDGVLHERQAKLDSVDGDLLSVIRSVESNGITGLFVYQEGLVGFAASRLLLTTLNTYAWANDIPIAEVRSDDPNSLRRTIADVLHAQKQFTKQLLLRYAGPADITPSRKQKKFTIK